MKVGVKLLVPSALMFILSCLGPARANEIGIGAGVMCDTAAQTARYVVRGKEVARARAKHEPVSIVEIFVVGIVTPLGINRITPRPQFTLFPIEEYSV